MELRRLEESDFHRVAEIFADSFGASGPPPLEYVANLCRTYPEGCLVAVAAGEVIGYATSHRSGSVGYIGNLAVRPDQRGKGYGKALTIAVRDRLASCCEVVGLAVDPANGRNLELYTSCGFVPTMPSCHLAKLGGAQVGAASGTIVRAASELHGDPHALIEEVAGWIDDVFPGLDFTRDLELFATLWPERLWIARSEGRVSGFLASHELFRGDPWGAVRPGAGALATFHALVAALEASETGRMTWFHAHTSFPRLLDVLRARGYRIASHKTCMVLGEHARAWPQASDALLLRPWWS